MKTVLILFSMISVLNEFATTKTQDTEPVEQSIKKLNHKIIEDIKGNKKPHDSEVYKDTYDYVDAENIHAPPKGEHDSKKQDKAIESELKTATTEKLIHSPEEVDITNKHTTSESEHYKKNLDKLFKKREPKTTTIEAFNHSPENVNDVGPLRIRKDKKKKSKKSSKIKYADVFYRRTIFDANARDKPQKWTHCLDLLSPFLNGFLSNISETKRVTASDNNIRRLSYLLALNMTDATTEEIRAILYEISTLQLRLFQWDIGAMTKIMSILIHDFRHDFKGLKYGIKALFASWKLNTSNLTRVFTQSRIFRPPCLQISEYGGSTVKPEHTLSRFTKRPSKPKCNRRNEDDDCIDLESNE